MQGQQTKTIIVKAPLAEVYRSWAGIDQFPSFMRDVLLAKDRGGGTSAWAMRGPLGSIVEWEAETTRLEEPTRIAWNSTCGDLETSGQVTFTALPYGETEITFAQHYEAERWKETVARLFDDPDHKLMRLLRDFKAHVEGRAARRAA